MRCQKTYLADGHCKKGVFGASKWCRWHKIIEEFRADLSRYPKIAAQGMMLASSGLAYGAGYSLWMYSKQGAVVWGILAVFLIGSSAKYFADGCIAQDHPFSQFALWGQLLAFGLAVEVTAGATLGFYLVSHYSEAEGLAGELSLPSFLAKFAPSLLTAAIVLEVGVSVRLLVKRIFFWRRPMVNSLLTIMIWGMVGTALRPIWMPPEQHLKFEQKSKSISESPRVPSSQSDAERRRADNFWQPALGDHYWTPVIAAWVLGFIVAEVINKRMRSRDRAVAVFRATVWPSFPVCYGSPLLGAEGARYIMVWAKAQNSWLFVAVAISINAVAATLGTIAVVRIYLANLRRSGSSAIGKRERRQELELFLRIESPVPGIADTSDQFAYTAHEIQLALEYSGVGRIEGYGKQDDYFIIQMVGSSAVSMFDALRDLLANIYIAPGSFAVMRYGDGSQEKMFEL